MEMYEYKVIPAPERGKKAKAARTSEARFAFALETAMNELAKDGWEYHRAETLPSEERSGLTGKTTIYRNLLVFRRLRASGQSNATLSGEVLPAPESANGPAVPSPVPFLQAPTSSTEGDAQTAPPVVRSIQDATEETVARTPDLQAEDVAEEEITAAPASTAEAAAAAAAALRLVGQPGASDEADAAEETASTAGSVPQGFKADMAHLMGRKKQSKP